MSTMGAQFLHLACKGGGSPLAPLSVTPLLATLYGRYIVPGPEMCWGSEDESTQAKFFCNQAQNYECTWYLPLSHLIYF